MDTKSGKGKASLTPDDQRNSSEVHAASAQREKSSLSSRVVASAKGLANDFLAPGAHIASELSQVSGSSKGSSSSSSQQNQERGETSHLHETSLTSGSASSHTGGYQVKGFRTLQESKWSNQELESFFASQQPVFDSNDTIESSSSQGNWVAEFHSGASGIVGSTAEPSQQQSHNGVLTDSGPGCFTEIATQSIYQHSHGIGHDEYNDGAEVRALLDNPNFVAIADVYDFEDLTNPPAALFSQDFSESEREAVSKIKADLSPPPAHNLSRSERSDFSLFYPNFEDQEGQTLFASPEQRTHLLNQWSSAIDSYVEDVWGDDLLPVVRVVREELEKAKTTGTGSLEPRALARLKMVLGHISEQHAFQYMDIQTNLTNAQTSLKKQNDFPQQTIQSHLQTQAQQHMNETHHVHKHDYYHYHQKNADLNENLQEQDQVGEFHCPWISCHESFRSITELRRHSVTHDSTPAYPCPHASCLETFSSRGNWAKHIKVAHHDLLDTSITAVKFDEAGE